MTDIIQKMADREYPTQAQVTTLLSQCRSGRNGEIAREALVENHLRLIIAILRSRSKGDDQYVYEHIYTAYMGLRAAVDSAIKYYDPAFGKFRSYAYKAMQQHLNRDQQQDRVVRIPSSAFTKLNRVKKATLFLGKEKNDRVSLREVAEELGSSENKLRKAYAAVSEIQSLDAPVFEPSEPETLFDQIPNPHFMSPADLAEIRDEGRYAARCLLEFREWLLEQNSPKHMRVFCLHFGVFEQKKNGPRTFRALAKICGSTNGQTPKNWCDKVFIDRINCGKFKKLLSPIEFQNAIIAVRLAAVAYQISGEEVPESFHEVTRLD